MRGKEGKLLPFIKLLHPIEDRPFRWSEEFVVIPDVPETSCERSMPSSVREALLLRPQRRILVDRMQRRTEFLKMLDHGGCKWMARAIWEVLFQKTEPNICNGITMLSPATMTREAESSHPCRIVGSTKLGHPRTGRPCMSETPRRCIEWRQALSPRRPAALALVELGPLGRSR